MLCFVPIINLFCLNRTEDHLEEALRNVEELSERIAEQESTIKSLTKQVWLKEELFQGFCCIIVKSLGFICPNRAVNSNGFIAIQVTLKINYDNQSFN